MSKRIPHRTTVGRLPGHIDKLQADMEAPRINKHIEDSMTLARELGFSGTPSFVIGEETAPGLIPLEELRRLVQLQRESAS